MIITRFSSIEMGICARYFGGLVLNRQGLRAKSADGKTVEPGAGLAGAGKVSAQGFLHQSLDFCVDVFGLDEEWSAEALQGELLRGGEVVPGNFDAEFGGGSAVAAEGDSGGLSLGSEGGKLLRGDAGKDLRRALSHDGSLCAIDG